jgi:hypothetical protein
MISLAKARARGGQAAVARSDASDTTQFLELVARPGEFPGTNERLTV